ncbi:MAG: glycosyltransferase [Firmicutes bacterium]|nr:glycosyltransferase [Bacillota bacterium]
MENLQKTKPISKDFVFSPRGDRYIQVKTKFWISHFIAFLWAVLSVFLSIPWVHDLSKIVTMPVAILIIAGIGYIPGYINAFNVTSLILDKQPALKIKNPGDAVTVLIACLNEERNIATTLKYIKNQDYQGNIKVIVIDNGSTDRTCAVAKRAADELSLSVQIIKETNKGKNNALNTALQQVNTEYVITLDADTLLHSSAIKLIVARMKSAPEDVSAIAGAVLARNSRQSFITKLQEWDYFLGISSIKRMQGLFQGTLVAQGAFSLYKTDSIKEIGGWKDAIGEDIILTWEFLHGNKKVYFEPRGVAFTEVPSTLKHLARQRSRWARGMIEGLKMIKPWQHPINYIRYLTGINLIMPYLDIVYTFCWIPGLILAFFGKFWIVGPMTLFVIPLALIQNYILYSYQRKIFKELDLKIRKNKLGYILYVLCYQMLMSPLSIFGYSQEIMQMKRTWK